MQLSQPRLVQSNDIYFSSQMTQDSIRAFVHENFGKDYFPVYHGQTNIVTPLALIVKRKREWWKRPFGKAEMIILGGLESYIVDEKENHFHISSESKLVKESKSLQKTETGEVSRYVFYARGWDRGACRTFQDYTSGLVSVLVLSLKRSKAGSLAVPLRKSSRKI